MGAVTRSEVRVHVEAGPQLYLIYSGEPSPENGWRIEGSLYRTSDQLCLVRTTLSRSRVYHAVKRQMRLQASHMVARLADDPKFKGMARGTLNWLRRTDRPFNGSDSRRRAALKIGFRKPN